VQAKLSLFIGAPFEKAGFFVCAEVVEGAANKEVAATDAVCANMEVRGSGKFCAGLLGLPCFEITFGGNLNES
jgi:hypothetical protein